MKLPHPFSSLSLRVKLVLSYLAVTLGAIIILTLAVAVVISSFFTQNEYNTLRRQAAHLADQIEFNYRLTGSLGTGNDLSILTNEPYLIVIADTNGKQVVCSQPAFLSQRNCDDTSVKQALTQTLHNQEIDGDVSVSTTDNTFTSLYVTVPISYNGQIIGSLFLSTPERHGPNPFLSEVYQAMMLSGIVISLVVVVFSFLLAHRFTYPLEVLTSAAEQVKQGKYTQRVTLPQADDELGRLAQAFNEMADTIEADVTELRRQEQARRDLIANIAHDLATPLTAIQGFSEALADDVIHDPAARQETAQRIAREVQRLRRLVADIRNMSSLEGGHVALDLAPLDIHTLVDETLAVIAPECEQMHITVKNEILPTTPLVLADSDRIAQVLLNLLDNARRHTPTGGSISVGAHIKDHYLHIKVSDTGSGITPDDLPHIFERFYRADRSRTTTTGGSGLGLAIVRAIITMHNGTIWAESTPGQGTHITFTLPLVPAQLPQK